MSKKHRKGDPSESPDAQPWRDWLASLPYLAHAVALIDATLDRLGALPHGRPVSVLLRQAFAAGFDAGRGFGIATTAVGPTADPILQPLRPAPRPDSPLGKVLLADAPRAPECSWLFIAPEQGQVVRHRGRLFALKLNDALLATPLLLEGRPDVPKPSCFAVRPDVVVLNEDTMEVVWATQERSCFTGQGAFPMSRRPRPDEVRNAKWN